MSYRFNEEKTKKTIAFVLDKISSVKTGKDTNRNEIDLRLLEEYSFLFKKEVPLLKRSKAAAYMLMLCDQGKNIRHPIRENFHNAPKPYRNRNETVDEKRGNTGDIPQTERHYPLAEEDSKRLFFSVGRSRRVFPREILGLINTKTSISREDIGAIKILDNYSFVQVRDTVAGKIIETLNGQNFRGRPLTVNYAKSREEQEEEESEQSQDNPEEEDI